MNEIFGPVWRHFCKDENNPVVFHSIAGICGKVYINGQKNILHGIQTRNEAVASADAFDLASPADHSTNNAIAGHSMNAALRGVITEIMNMPDADPKPGKGDNILIL